jgi:glycosyltransferase involved in cell wall biosynthesis
MTADAGGRAPILFYLPHLKTGGAEMVFVRLADGLAAQGFDTRIVLDRKEGELVAATARPVSALGASRTLAAILPLAAMLRRVEPAVVFSAISPNNIALLIARWLARSDAAVVVGEHTLLSRQFGKDAVFHLLPPLVRLMYPHAEAIVTVSQAGRDDLARILDDPAVRIDVLPNPAVARAPQPGPAPHPWLADGIPTLVAAGRLTPVKDFSTLLRAFARVAAGRPCRLAILGEGPERTTLEAERDRLGLADRVILPGVAADPLAWFARAAAVVVSSRYEGFGLVLAEAMSCGTPVVTTDAGGAPAEVVNGVGQVVPSGDDAALAAAIAATLDRPPSADALRRRAAMFSVEASVAAYAALIARLTRRRVR